MSRSGGPGSDVRGGRSAGSRPGGYQPGGEPAAGHPAGAARRAHGPVRGPARPGGALAADAPEVTAAVAAIAAASSGSAPGSSSGPRCSTWPPCGTGRRRRGPHPPASQGRGPGRGRCPRGTGTRGVGLPPWSPPVC